MIVYDDMEPTEKVRVYDKGITVNHDPEHRERVLAGYRNGDMVAPNLDTTEALRLMAREFIDSITQKRLPISDGYAGYRVVRLLEAAQQSMQLERTTHRTDEYYRPAQERGLHPCRSRVGLRNHSRFHE